MSPVFLYKELLRCSTSRNIVTYMWLPAASAEIVGFISPIPHLALVLLARLYISLLVVLRIFFPYLFPLKTLLKKTKIQEQPKKENRWLIKCIQGSVWTPWKRNWTLLSAYSMLDTVLSTLLYISFISLKCYFYAH